MPGSLCPPFGGDEVGRGENTNWSYCTTARAALTFESCGYRKAGCSEQLANRRDRHKR